MRAEIAGPTPGSRCSVRADAVLRFIRTGPDATARRRGGASVTAATRTGCSASRAVVSGATEDGAGPRTDTEKALVEIWQEVLSLDRVGIHDNFFDLGGHSLLATRMMSRLRDRLNVELPLRSLFDSTTLAQLAEKIEASRNRQGDARPLSKIVPVSREQYRRNRPAKKE